MKKVLPIVVLIVLVAGVWMFASSRRSGTTATPGSNSGQSASTANSPDSAHPPVNPLSNVPANNTTNNGATDGTSSSPILPDDGDGMPEVKPAAESYKSADEALSAVTKAAKDYDDSVLEQFTQPGDDCTWCPEFYRSVKDLVSSGNTPQDQRSYLAEILAISGRVENIQTLVESIKSAKTTDEADVFSEALELSVGKDDVTKYIGDQMTSQNETLREASVAAVTNQGSRLAAELLVKHTLERGDPDGYYSLGIGLGEFIPDDDALPALQEMVQKRDQYSHLAVKAMINSGMDGLKAVFDELENSKDPEADRKMLKDAIDHVNFEDGLEDYLKEKIASTKQPVVSEFGKKILDEFSQSGEQSDLEEPAARPE